MVDIETCKEKYYFSLNVYLSRADDHYINGRLQWHHIATHGACSSFWLAFEQLIKLYIVQNRLENGDLKDEGIISETLNKIKREYPPAKKIINSFTNKNSSLDLASYGEIIGEICEHYSGRRPKKREVISAKNLKEYTEKIGKYEESVIRRKYNIMRVMRSVIDREFMKIDKSHKTSKLIKKLDENTHFKLESHHVKCLEKVNEYFHRRYVTNEGTSISLGLLNMIDDLYFLIRDQMSEYIPCAMIDEIRFNRDHEGKQSVPYFHYAFHENQHFRSRKHPVAHQVLSRGGCVTYDGVTDTPSKR